MKKDDRWSVWVGKLRVASGGPDTSPMYYAEQYRDEGEVIVRSGYGSCSAIIARLPATGSPNKLSHYRKVAGLTLQELADEVGSSKAYMWQLENKDNPQPSVGLAWRISLALGFPLADIFDVTQKETI